MKFLESSFTWAGHTTFLVHGYYTICADRTISTRRSHTVVMETDATEKDAFKMTEKALKQLYKRRTLGATKRTKQQRLAPTATIDSTMASCEKEWNELVVDVLKPNSRVHELASPSSSSSRTFEISGVADGFFFISNGLTTREQLEWAQIALEEYSTAEHTNLENLKRLKEADCNFPKDVTEDQKQRLAEVFAATKSKSVLECEEGHGDEDSNDDSRNLWRHSVAECNGLKRFQSLRWVSLGNTILNMPTIFYNTY